MGLVEVPVCRTRRFAFVTPAARIRAAQSRKMAVGSSLLKRPLMLGSPPPKTWRSPPRMPTDVRNLKSGPRRQRAAEVVRTLVLEARSSGARSLLP